VETDTRRTDHDDAFMAGIVTASASGAIPSIVPAISSSMTTGCGVLLAIVSAASKAFRRDIDHFWRKHCW